MSHRETDDPPTAARDVRRNEILNAATDVLIERGYRDTTMLEIARRAGASKETLYAWFGDKSGLFTAVIRRNAETVETAMDGSAPAETALTEFGAAVLRLLLGESAVAINRAAIAEAISDPTLARALLAAGRDTTLPEFATLLAEFQRRGTLEFEDPDEAASDFIALLIGNQQVVRLLGAAAEPDEAWVVRRAARTAQKFLSLYGSGSTIPNDAGAPPSGRSAGPN